MDVFIFFCFSFFCSFFNVNECSRIESSDMKRKRLLFFRFYPTVNGQWTSSYWHFQTYSRDQAQKQCAHGCFQTSRRENESIPFFHFPLSSMLFFIHFLNTNVLFLIPPFILFSIVLFLNKLSFSLIINFLLFSNLLYMFTDYFLLFIIIFFFFFFFFFVSLSFSFFFQLR